MSKKIRGIRSSIPPGYVLGRPANAGSTTPGDVQPMKLSDFASKGYARAFGLPFVADGYVLANTTGANGLPAGVTLTSLMDYTLASNAPAQGQILYRGASGWVVLAPGTSGYVLATQGASADPHWVLATSSVGADPTATAGPAAVNGVATTFMRSDGAPAIQKASSSQFGIVEVDGTTIIATGGLISATGFSPAAAAFHPGYQAGKKYGSPLLTAGTGSTLVTTTGTLYFTPFFVGTQTTFTKAWARTAATGANVEMGIYTDSGGQPGTLIADWGDVASATTSDVSITISQALAPGWYWLAISASATVTLSGVPANGTGAWLMGQTTISVNPAGYSQAWTFSTGNLPAVGSLSAVAGNCPSVWLSP